jgi:hypothetical protein
MSHTVKAPYNRGLVKPAEWPLRGAMGDLMVFGDVWEGLFLVVA